MYQPHPLDARLAEALAPGRLYAVGGRVRDELRAVIEGIEVPAKDLDYVVTGLTLDELTQRLEQLGRVDLVGAAFAVAKLTTDGQTVDVALPRRERSTGHGHREFEVQSGPEIPLEDDLARRDFRMNMVARALPGGELVDPYHGEADVRAGLIDILTPVTFEEDPLRMLRAAQFTARFGYAPTEATIAAMRAAAPLVRTVAPERALAVLRAGQQRMRPKRGRSRNDGIDERRLVGDAPWRGFVIRRACRKPHRFTVAQHRNRLIEG
jgi:tRNA nucleotidyltransferase/poly(A) polymerase